MTARKILTQCMICMISLPLAGCITKYVPMADFQVNRLESSQAESQLVTSLTDVVAKGRFSHKGGAAAMGVQRGDFKYSETLTSPDNKIRAYVFDMSNPTAIALGAKGKVVYVVQLTDNAAVDYEEAEDGSGKCKFNVRNALMCVGKPVKEDIFINSNKVDFVFQEQFTFACSGNEFNKFPLEPSAAGFSIWFDSKGEMQQFARVFLGAFPTVN